MNYKTRAAINIFGILSTLVPLVPLGLPWWANTLIIAALFSLKGLNWWIEVALWVWSFIVVVRAPFTWFSVVYYVLFGLYALCTFLPLFLILGAKGAGFFAKDSEPDEPAP